MKKLASRKDPRVIDLLIAYGPMGYGIYALLVDYLGERKALRSANDIKRIAYELHADAETVRAILEDFDLFDCSGNEFHNLKTKVPKQSGNQQQTETPTQETPVATGSTESGSGLSIPSFSASKKRRERRKRLSQARQCLQIQQTKRHGPDYEATLTP